MKRFFRDSKRGNNRPSRNQEMTFQGSFQQLEQRRMLRTYVVDTLLDDDSGVPDNMLSLREAVIAANTNMDFGDALAGDGEGDLIVFDASIDGGTISLLHGQFEITDDLVIGDNNQTVIIDANSNSRIFSVDGNEKYQFINLTLLDGNANSGGTFNMAGGGTLDVRDVIISGSGAIDRGGAINSEFSNVFVIDSKLNINRVSGPAGEGGAIATLGGTLTIMTSTIFANEATFAGGGISVRGSAVEVSDSDLRDNFVNQGSGGAVAIWGDFDFVMKSSFVVGNSASVNGGGFWVEAAAGRLVIRDNSVLDNNTASGDAANQGGGAIYNGGSLVRVLDSTLKGNSADGTNGAGGGILAFDHLNVRRSTISGNSATVFGGGIQIINGFARLEDSVLGGSSVEDGNVAGLDGGGIHVNGEATVQIDETDVWNNFAERDGGGAWIQSQSEMLIANGSRFNLNQANSDVNGGGGIFNNGGTIDIQSSTFQANTAAGDNSLGGGLHSIGGQVVVTGGAFVQNEANRGGGAISLIAAELVMTDVLVSTNVAGDGGGLFAAVNSDAILNDTIVAGGGATRGGGIAAFDSKVVIRDDSSIVNNRATSDVAAGQGGGIYSQGGLLRIMDSVVSDNQALGFVNGDAVGGGIAVLSGVVNLRDSWVVSNAADGNGGGLHTWGATASVQNTIFGGVGPSDANIAIDGAGIYFDGPTLAGISGGSITENVAFNRGGGIFNHPNSTLGITTGTLINSNNAGVGGGIYNAGHMSLMDVVVSENDADRNGGGISNQPAAIAVLDTVMIDDNLAELLGGGVDNSGIVNFANKIEILNNVAGVTGGGVHTENTGLSIFGDITFVNNSPNDTNP